MKNRFVAQSAFKYSGAKAQCPKNAIKINGIRKNSIPVILRFAVSISFPHKISTPGQFLPPVRLALFK